MIKVKSLILFNSDTFIIRRSILIETIINNEDSQWIFIESVMIELWRFIERIT